MLEVIISAIMSFIGTNIDDLFVDTIFFAGASGKKQDRSIVIGKYLGIGALVLVSLLGAFGLRLLPGKYIGLLGLVPMGLGIKAAIEYFKERKSVQEECFAGGNDTNKADEAPHLQKHRSLLWSVALVTIANGADNIGVYIPLFAGFRTAELLCALVVFAMSTGLWCLLADRLSRLPVIQNIIHRYKHILIPIVLIGLGLYILVDAYLL